MDALTVTLESQGFAVVPSVIDVQACEMAAGNLDALPADSVGSRRLLAHEWCRSLARQVRRHPVISQLLPLDAVAVQCTMFDKSPAKNWLVALHQDRSIPVRRRVGGAALTGWSEKEGDVFVQPPSSVLEQITAVRIHLDPCPIESGALRVVPGSHRDGLLSAIEVEQHRQLAGEQDLPVARGGALLMKPLILHASSKSKGTSPRRVLRFVFGPRELPLGLEWRHAI